MSDLADPPAGFRLVTEEVKHESKADEILDAIFMWVYKEVSL
jgi:hypothetical protein